MLGAVQRGISGTRAAVRSFYSYSREPFMALDRQPKTVSAEEALSVVKSGEYCAHRTGSVPNHFMRIQG